MKKTIILFVMVFLLSGCSSPKCIKSHEEKDKCIAYTPVIVGNITVMTPHYYDCVKTVCDEYEEVQGNETTNFDR